MDGLIEGGMDEPIDRSRYGLMDGWIYGWTDG